MLDYSKACKERHERFVRRVVNSSQVWGLKSEEGWALAPSNEGEGDVMPFWSDRAYAAQCARDDWDSYEPTAIPLSGFLEHWLPGMARDEYLVGTNWNAHLVGLEITPAELHRELSEAILQNDSPT